MWRFLLLFVFFGPLGLSGGVYADSACQHDVDCACGVHIETGKCEIGSKKEINEALQPCPDFCEGIAGHLKTQCVNGKCQQVSGAPVQGSIKER